MPREPKPRDDRRLSAELYRRSDIDGVLYHSRLTGAACVAVYDRAVTKLTAGKAVPAETLTALVPALTALHIVLAD